MKQRELRKYLENQGFVMYRQSGKHKIYQHTVSRKKLTMAGSPSDRMAYKNVIQAIKKYKLTEV